MIHLNVQASDHTQLEGMWEWLRGCQAQVDIVDGEMHVTVDLGQPGTLALVEPLPADTVELAEPNWTHVNDRGDIDYGDNDVVVETGTEDLEVVHTPPKPEVTELHLRRHILALLAEHKRPAKDLAAELGVDVATVKAELAGLKEEGLVRLAGVAGWALTDEVVADRITRTPVDADAARRRAMEAM